MASMNSPFPGMDPYLEAYWPDVHTKLVTYSADALNASLPRGLIARTQERVGIESEAGDAGVVIPDVSVVRTRSRRTSEGGGGLALADLRLVAVVENPIERFIEVFRVDGLKLVTVLEILSPSNKGAGWAEFVDMRKALLAAGVNFVEIDLTRTGDWERLLKPQKCPPENASAYRYTIRVPQEASVAYLQPISIRKALPDVPIPLRDGDAAILLPLQSLIDRVYANGRYGELLHYDRVPEPHLDEGDTAWANQLITTRSRSAS